MELVRPDENSFAITFIYFEFSVSKLSQFVQRHRWYHGISRTAATGGNLLYVFARLP
jgi:hypothetical protein